MMYPPLMADARKRNPYVGYIGVPEGRRPSFYLPGNHMKKSPYIGVFRHAPPAFVGRRHPRPLEGLKKSPALVCTVNTSVDSGAKSCTAPLPNRLLLSGRLPGGAEYDREGRHGSGSSDSSNISTAANTAHAASFPPMTWLDEKISDSVSCAREVSPVALPQAYLCRSLVPAYRTMRRLQSSWANQSTLIALLTLRLPNVFRRLLLLEDFERDSSILSDGKDKQTHFQSSSDSEDEDDSSRSSNGNSSGSGSSQTKQLHQASSVDRDEDYSSSVALLLDLLDSGDNHDAAHRLDYVITQTDISRMARNASRHLDVASILSLPTVTYRSLPPKTVTITTGKHVGTSVKADTDEDAGAAAPVGSNIPSQSADNDGNGGMWSWLMVSNSPGEEDIANCPIQPKNENENQKEDVPVHHLCEAAAHEDGQQQSCVICLDNFQDGDKLRVLPCSHLFHTGCIDHWLLGTYSDEDCVTSGCPMCKKHATASEEHVSPSSADGSVPSWAFARLGDALAKESDELSHVLRLSKVEDMSLPSSVSVSS